MNDIIFFLKHPPTASEVVVIVMVEICEVLKTDLP